MSQRESLEVGGGVCWGLHCDGLVVWWVKVDCSAAGMHVSMLQGSKVGQKW